MAEYKPQQISPFNVFFDWCYDGDPKSPIPRGENIPDITKYNSPINEGFILRMFVNHFTITMYLNEFINNIGVRYIDREDLLKFIKQLIRDYKINRNSFRYLGYKRDTKLIDAIKKKFLHLKNFEVDLLHDKIQISPDKSNIYCSFGLDEPKKSVFRQKKMETGMSVKKFLSTYFVVSEVHAK